MKDQERESSIEKNTPGVVVCYPTSYPYSDEIEKKIRIGFVRKAYSFLVIQILITFGFLVLTIVYKFKISLRENILFFIGIAYIIFLFLVFLKSACIKENHRKISAAIFSTRGDLML